ncbi:MAG: hypothetical protein WC511_07125 [Candidatus Pacearchaeota archaeon]
MRKIKQQIAKIYKERQKAHDILLKCDIALDKILKKIYEEKK